MKRRFALFIAVLILATATTAQTNIKADILQTPVTRNTRARQYADAKIESWDFSGIPTAAAASDYLHSIVPYASTGVTHPDVYYNPAGWNGWKYWMAATPYSGSDAGIENPSLWVSQDGTNWQVPSGVTNPIATSTYSTAGDYNADTELIDGLDGSLWLCWLHQNLTAAQGSGAKFKCRQSFDGVSWANETTMFHWTNYAVDRPASPAILYDGTQWVMYYMEIGGPSPVAGSATAIMKRTARTITGPWSNAVDVSPTAPTGKAWWHLNANRIGNQTVLLIQVANTGTYGATASQLYLAWSQDGTNFTIGTTPVLDSSGSWHASLYRSAMVPKWDGYNLRLGLWYVGIGATWQIGYTEALVPAKFASGVTFGSAGKANFSTPDGYDVVLKDGNGIQVLRGAKYSLAWIDGVETQMIQFGDPTVASNVQLTRPGGVPYGRFFINANTLQVGPGNWNQAGVNHVVSPVAGDSFEIINTDGSIGSGATNNGRIYANGGVKNAPGMQHVRKSTTCTTAATAGAVCNFDVTWPVAFADTNYTPVCMGQGITGIPVLGATTRATDKITLTIVAATATATTYGAVNCIAMHD